MDRTYHIWTIGCQMNQADSRYLAARLEELGLAPAARADEADVLVVNTCVVRQQAEDKGHQYIQPLKGLKRRRPDATVAVMGCLVGRKEIADLRVRYPHVDVFMGPSDLQPLIRFLDGKDVLEKAPGLPPSQRGSAVAAFVPVVLGCSHACSFCVIPHRRGPEHSRPKVDILDEARELVGLGIRDITLLGQIVDRYGLDLGNGTNLPGLLREVAAIDGLARLRFLTSHPSWMTDELLDTIASVDRICPYIEIPLQAGHDEILERMKRGYTAAEYRKLVDKIRSRIPGVALSTDVIVGFPGETDEQFMESYRLMADLEFDMAHIAKYSERPVTLAARQFKDDVPPEEKERRRVMLEAVLAEKLEKKHRALRGATVEVLAEERQRNGQWRGRTPQNQLVFFQDERDWLGKLVNITIEEPAAFALKGRATDA